MNFKATLMILAVCFALIFCAGCATIRGATEGAAKGGTEGAVKDWEQLVEIDEWIQEHLW